jgi:hypothetical protein
MSKNTLEKYRGGGEGGGEGGGQEKR